jgi:hypothetical protein
MGILEAIRDGIMRSLSQHEQERVAKLEAEMSGLVFTPDPSHLGRVVRSQFIEQQSEGYMIPGSMFSDGKARLVVGPHTTVDEARIDWPDA